MPAIIVSSVIFVVCLFLIFSEKIDRTIAALAGALVMLLAGRILHFLNEADIATSIDWNTLGLLLGMMILVALLEPTGFFQYLAVWAGRLSRGNPLRLLVLLGSVTTVLSMFLNNVTTVVLIAPVTILICEILGTNATPYLLAEALLSDIGGVATQIGDPPNVLVSTAAGLSFVDFIIHSAPIVVVCWVAGLAFLAYQFRGDLRIHPDVHEALMQLDPNEALKDRRTAFRCLIVLGVAIVLFFFEGALRISPSAIALAAAVIMLVWIRPSIQEVWKRIEWSVLVFFAALFIMVGGLEKAGTLHVMASLLHHSVEMPPVLLGIITIWLVAGLSAVVDNVPITIALIPIIHELGATGVNILPLWWALILGAGFGGNGTIIGSSANIVVATLSQKTRNPINSRIWNRSGLPVMLLTCTIASLLFALVYPLLSR